MIVYRAYKEYYRLTFGYVITAQSQANMYHSDVVAPLEKRWKDLLDIIVMSTLDNDDKDRLELGEKDGEKDDNSLRLLYYLNAYNVYNINKKCNN
jgi:hypothetical protein